MLRTATSASTSGGSHPGGAGESVPHRLLGEELRRRQSIAQTARKPDSSWVLPALWGLIKTSSNLPVFPGGSPQSSPRFLWTPREGICTSAGHRPFLLLSLCPSTHCDANVCWIRCEIRHLHQPYAPHRHTRQYSYKAIAVSKRWLKIGGGRGHGRKWHTSFNHVSVDAAGSFPHLITRIFSVASTFTLCSPSVFPALLSHLPFSLVLISLSFSKANANGPHFPLSLA